MKKISSKTAFTLIELIVSSLLVAVVTLGIITINTVLSNNNQDYGQRYLVKSETQATLNHILNNASLAKGDASSTNGMLDLGILIGAGAPPGMNDADSFCIHQDANSNMTTTSLAGDIWLCYTWSSSTYQINYCMEPFNINSSPYRGATSCTTAAINNALCTSGGFSSTLCTGPTFLGTANNFTSYTPTFTANGTQLLFSITLQNCFNNSLSSCQSSGTSSAPTDNPEVQLSGSVIPSQESM